MHTATRRATRAISATAAGASDMKATTSCARAMSKSPDSKGSDSAGASRTSTFGGGSRGRLSTSGVREALAQDGDELGRRVRRRDRGASRQQLGGEGAGAGTDV